MAVDTVKLVNLVAHNLPNSQVAAALGLSPGRITQLLDHPQVQELVLARKQELATQEIDKVTTLDSISDALLDQIHGLVSEADSLGEAVRAFETIEKIRATKISADTGPKGEGIEHITMVVPTFIQQNLQVIVNNVNEITTIGKRSMAAMPTMQVHQLIKEHTATPKLSLQEGDTEHDHERENNTGDRSQDGQGGPKLHIFPNHRGEDTFDDEGNVDF